MNAVERLGAAIAKLEQLKAEGTSSPWVGRTNILGIRRLMDSEGGVLAEMFDATDHGDESFENTDLIVTLHRTIDAQLAILKAAREDCAKFGRKPSEFFENDLALADAILGDNS